MQTVDRLTTYFTPEHYQLNLVLSKQDSSFEGTVALSGTTVGLQKQLRLHSKDLAISSVTVGDQSAEYELKSEQDELVITYPEPTDGETTVTIQFAGKITDSMHGIYPCYYQHEGIKKSLLATQFESHHAREAFPCIDEPAAKATFDVTLYTEKNISVLGNMPTTNQSEDDDWLITSFETSPRMSPYLLAFVAGELHSTSAQTKDGVTVGIWATPAQKAESLSFALTSAIKTIEFFDEYFGIPYPLPKCDLVALPDFAAGAMENWGLITYREICLLVDPESTSVSVKEYVAVVIAHELSHQWFGNLVTMKWWDDLWLNESFANLMEYVAVDALYPEWDIWTSFVSGEALPALRRDALPGVQSVKTAVNHPDEIGTLFDGAIVYAKGARLMNMMYHYVGDEAFRAGLRQYFQTHKYGNTIGEDLWHAMSEASGKDVAGFMEMWLLQPGFPLLSVDQEDTSLTLSQSKFTLSSDSTDIGDNILWPIPVNSNESSAPQLFDANEGVYQLDSSRPIRVNSGAHGHYSVRYENNDHRKAIADSISSGDVAPTERILLLNDGSMQARAGIGSMTEVLQLLAHFKHETSEPVWDMIAVAIADTKRLIEEDDEAETQFKRFVRELIQSEYVRLGWDPTDGESNSDTKLRASILGLGIYSEDQAIISEAKKRYIESDSIDSLPADIRDVILVAVVKYDDSNEFDTLLQLHNETQNAELKQELAAALTATKDSGRIKRLLSVMTNQDIVRLQDVDHWFIWLIRNRYGRSDAWQWMVDNWTWIEKNFSDDKTYENFPRYASSAFSSDEWLERYQSFFTPLASKPALSRTIGMGIADITSRAAWQRRDGSLVKHYLSEYFQQTE